MKINDAETIANKIRPVWPSKAEEIDKAVAKARALQSDGVAVSIDVRYKLEKFDGDYEPGKQPVETIEGEG